MNGCNSMEANGKGYFLSISLSKYSFKITILGKIPMLGRSGRATNSSAGTLRVTNST
jgi:hypothetical protein